MKDQVIAIHTSPDFSSFRDNGGNRYEWREQTDGRLCNGCVFLNHDDCPAVNTASGEAACTGQYHGGRDGHWAKVAP